MARRQTQSDNATVAENQKLTNSLLSEVQSGAQPLVRYTSESPRLSVPDERIRKHLEERRGQRRYIIRYTAVTTAVSFSILIVLLGVQGYKRFKYPDLYPDFQILDNFQLEIFITGVFSQVFAIILIITRSLWNENEQNNLFRDKG